MDAVTFTLRPDQIELLAELSGDEGECDSKSEAMRMIIDQYDDLQSEVEDLETEVERLRNERRVLLNQREEHTELVRHVQDEREDRQRRRQKENAPVWRRAKWWVLGVPLEDQD